jgi:hypothetical protein
MRAIRRAVEGTRYDERSKEILRRLGEFTQGYLGDLTELVSEATMAAINDGTYRILRKHLDGVGVEQASAGRVPT